MANGMNGINKAMATAKAVAKKSTKVFVAALPIATVVANVASAIEENPGNLGAITHRLVKSYTGIDMVQGTWELNQAMRGAGSLLIAGAVSKALTMFV